MQEINEETSCLPCVRGEHEGCRHYPQGGRFSSPGSEKGKLCACEKSGHVLGAGTCAANVVGDWDSHRCGKPTKGVWQERNGFVSRGGTHEIEVCGVHLGARRRVKNNDDARREKYATDAAERDRLRATEQACEEALERLRPILAGMGVHPDTLTVGRSGERRGILLPAETAEMLVGMAAELDELIGRELR